MIPLYKVSIPDNMVEILDPVFKSGMLTEGNQAKEFQKQLGQWIGNPNMVLTNSCTSAIVLALRLANVESGDQVITSPMTCLATNEPILTIGAHPVWCDIDPMTGNIDPSKIEACITPKTKAILFVDWAGTPAELDEINAIAQKHGLKTIEDAAHAFDALYKDIKVGNHCDYTCFSFQAIKHLTTVDGGALSCKTSEDAERAILLRWFGLKRGHNKSLVCWEGDVIEPGYKMHMNDVNATIGLEQLKTIKKRVLSHRFNGYILNVNLKNLIGLETTIIPTHTISSFWFFTILLKNQVEKVRISTALATAGIGNNISHTRNDIYSIFNAYKTTLPGVTEFSNRMLNIPCGWWVKPEDLDHITRTIIKIL